MRTCAVFLMAAVAAGGALAQQLEFKGVPMGASIEQLRAAVGLDEGFECEQEDEHGLCSNSSFTVPSTYAGEQISYLRAEFIHRKLASVTVSFMGQATVTEQAISSKYGQPTERRGSQQLAGTKKAYTAKLVEWKRRDGGSITMMDGEPGSYTIYVSISSPAKMEWYRKVNTASPKVKKDI